MNNKDSPVNLTDEMKASSQRRFEMKSEAEVDKTATKRKNTWNKNLTRKAKNLFI